MRRRDAATLAVTFPLLPVACQLPARMHLLPVSSRPYFKVISKEQASNLAYTPATLGLHKDLPFYERPPGVQLLHCVQQTQDVIGGENEFADSFQVAERLKEKHPKSYEILERTLIDFYDYGSDFLPDFHMLYRQRTFKLVAENAHRSSALVRPSLHPTFLFQQGLERGND